MKTSNVLSRRLLRPLIRLSLWSVLLLTVGFSQAQAQRTTDFRVVNQDSTVYDAPTIIRIERDTILDPQRVVTNQFWKDWFMFVEGGAHAFYGDYSDWGPYSGTISGDWGGGIGKWFTPIIGLKFEFIRGSSCGYTPYLKQHYGIGDTLYTTDGTAYRKMKTNWWDLGASAVLNLTRIFCGYEGYYSPRLKNQILLSAGIGGVHHMGFGHSNGSDNEWSGHLELQYSRFLDLAKHWSLDFKARGLFYQTNFDLEYGMEDRASRKFDYNLGFNLALAYHFGKGWSQSKEKVYQRDFRRVVVTQEREGARPIEHRILSFYVFFPNNYSGRDDAPLVEDAPVNAIDYLAAGIYTQRKFDNAQDAINRLRDGLSLSSLASSDVPTEPATKEFGDNVPRGYELSKTPLSLPFNAESVADFNSTMGYAYAPIFNGSTQWEYRIDKGTRTQKLLDAENYRENLTYSLNAHSGLKLVRTYMKTGPSETLVSFADVYGALHGNTGYIAQYADSATVAYIRDIFEHGIVTMVNLEGTATDQDNYTGADAANIRAKRNRELSENRAATISAWFKKDIHMNDVSMQVYVVKNLENYVQMVDETSTRGLEAKLRRCVKVSIIYLK